MRSSMNQFGCQTFEQSPRRTAMAALPNRTVPGGILPAAWANPVWQQNLRGKGGNAHWAEGME